jgi:hypothetical protein
LFDNAGLPHVHPKDATPFLAQNKPENEASPLSAFHPN